VITFLSILIATGLVMMGVGATIAMVWMFVSWLGHGESPMWFRWKEQMGFNQLEFIERTVNDMTGIPNKRERVIQQFGPAAGCLSLLAFIPMQVLVTPIGYIVLGHRKRVLRWRISRLPVEQANNISSEYTTWLAQ
jgi:hypothetical protein